MKQNMLISDRQHGNILKEYRQVPIERTSDVGIISLRFPVGVFVICRVIEEGSPAGQAGVFLLTFSGHLQPLLPF